MGWRSPAGPQQEYTAPCALGVFLWFTESSVGSFRPWASLRLVPHEWRHLAWFMAMSSGRHRIEADTPRHRSGHRRDTDEGISYSTLEVSEMIARDISKGKHSGRLSATTFQRNAKSAPQYGPSYCRIRRRGWCLACKTSPTESQSILRSSIGRMLKARLHLGHCRSSWTEIDLSMASEADTRS